MPYIHMTFGRRSRLTALGASLATKAFKKGTSIGAFTTTFDVTIT